MDIEDFCKQIRTMELPSEEMRFDLLRQLPARSMSRPSGFFSASSLSVPSSWFICLGAAEMNRSQTAPSLICL